MGFDYDGTGVEVKGFSGFEPLPENVYDFQIVNFKEQLTKNGDQMVNVTLEVVESLQFNGRMVWHNVTFFPSNNKHAGIALHFLKCIGQPWEGKIAVNPENWIGKRIRAKVRPEKYIGKDGVEKQKTSVVFVESPSTDPSSSQPKDETIPF